MRRGLMLVVLLAGIASCTPETPDPVLPRPRERRRPRRFRMDVCRLRLAVTDRVALEGVGR